MTERTRTFVGTLPDSEQQVLVTIFEEVTEIPPPGGESNMYPSTEEIEIVGMEVALREGEDRFARWGAPAKMTEQEDG